jgi:hypothetical protein
VWSPRTSNGPAVMAQIRVESAAREGWLTVGEPKRKTAAV